LFVADNAQATILAIDVGDTAPANAPRPMNVDKLDTRLAAYLGCSREDIFLKDMAVHPASHNVYLSVMRGSGAAALPVLIKVDASGTLSELAIERVPFAQTTIEDAPAADDKRTEVRVVRDKREGHEVEPRPGWKLRLTRDPLRTVTVTDMAYVDGLLLVAGASNEEFSSTLRRLPFPFKGKPVANSLEIFHVSHGKYETASPIRSFVPYAGNKSLLASYTCTPVVHFSLEGVKPHDHVKGRTVAELGAGNTPLDMVAFKRDNEEFLLVSHARHPLMKIACKDIDQHEGLTQPHEPVGVPRTPLPHEGVSRMGNLGHDYVLMVHQDDAGNVHLRSHRITAL
jgi:hypothetical protein